MTQATFKTYPVPLEELLRDCGAGKIQLPDFQRSWVWDEDRIKGLIASISQAFPMGALMTLEMKAGAADTFARRTVQGAPAASSETIPDQLLLDGQQRMTSLYQTCIRREVVVTITARQKLVRHWFYIDIAKALAPDADREEAIFAVPEDRMIKKNFDKEICLDLSTASAEYAEMRFPLNCVFDWDAWQEGFGDYWIDRGEPGRREIFKQFKNEVLQNFKNYRVPVIALGHDTSHEAVCLVFEKVNTGGKALDAFELVTAMYAAKGYRLRDDWYGTLGEPARDGRPAVPARVGMQATLQSFGAFADQKTGVLEKVANTEILQAIALLHSRQMRLDAVDAGRPESELPPVRATKQSLLDLPLEAYTRYRPDIMEGFKTAAKFLRHVNVFRAADLPYQTQLVPLAAILAIIGPKWENAATKARLARWYWCGIFGELYGSAIESRFALDVMQVPGWLDGGPTPSTIELGALRADRLRSMRSRLSAAYKGVHALLMQEGAKDFRTGQDFGQTVFFDEQVDIHHIFPAKWCTDNRIPPATFDSIINKTPISFKTNRIIGGIAPSAYLARMERGTAADPAIPPAGLDAHLQSHCIDPALLRADAFEAFMTDRESKLLALIARATGHGTEAAAGNEGGEDVPEDVARDAGLVAEAAD